MRVYVMMRNDEHLRACFVGIADTSKCDSIANVKVVVVL